MLYLCILLLHLPLFLSHKCPLTSPGKYLYFPHLHYICHLHVHHKFLLFFITPFFSSTLPVSQPAMVSLLGPGALPFALGHVWPHPWLLSSLPVSSHLATLLCTLFFPFSDFFCRCFASHFAFTLSLFFTNFNSGALIYFNGC